MRFALRADGAEHRIYVRYGPIAGFVIGNVVSAITVLLCLYLRVMRSLKLRAGKIQTDNDSSSEAEGEETLEA